MLCGAAVGYGVTGGGPNAPEISLTDLGRRIVAPLEEGDDHQARREAVLIPTVVRAFLEKYDGSPLPSDQIAYNVLESMGVPRARAEAVFSLIVDNAQSVNFLKTIKEKQYVDLGGAVSPARLVPPAARTENVDDLDDESDDGETAGTPSNLGTELPTRRTDFPSRQSNAIFLGHGKNRKPLEQLIKILDEYGIPHKEAVAEPNAGRPIPVKVADTMRECGAAILIFTADESYVDNAGNEVWKASENVAHELGAASVLYDNRIVIFKEDLVSLASNYSSIGYIEFAKDKLGDKGLDLFRELVGFKLVSFRVGP
jgi:hypothetical protein